MIIDSILIALGAVIVAGFAADIALSISDARIARHQFF